MEEIIPKARKQIINAEHQRARSILDIFHNESSNLSNTSRHTHVNSNSNNNNKYITSHTCKF